VASASRRARAAPALATAALLAGCAFLGLREQQERIAAFCEISGSVATAFASPSPRVVVLFRVEEQTGAHLVDHLVREDDGPWRFLVGPGTYAIGAFEDRNRDLVYQADEPARAPQDEPLRVLAPGAKQAGIPLVIQRDGRAPVEGPVDIAALQARSAAEQIPTSLGLLTVRGEIASLDDSRFDHSWSVEGMWKPLDFLLQLGAGIYFLEPFDPGRIPVLFVHGIEGSPRQFAELARSLDRERFQAWFYHYPSGGRLADVAVHLAGLVEDLRYRYRFPSLFAVAHSMGGLVTRAFVQHHFADTQRETVKLLVSISTPWAGQQSAEGAAAAAERGYAMVPAWLDLAPGSPFLDGLFFQDPGTRRAPRPLPANVAFHLLFGFQRDSSSFGPSEDGVVTLATELRPEAQREAQSLLGVDATHVGILSHPQTIQRLGEILGAAAR
jgi:pimeloyl-ACP methyl ester carboxylesterase